MMRLSTMLKVDSTIDEEGHSPLAACILGPWEHESSVRFFRSSANFVYTFRKDGARYFLRFAASTERTAAEISAEIALLNFLASQGMHVATPIMSNNGRYVETVETELGIFHAVVFAELPGREIEFAELNVAQFEAWGAALGKLHATTSGYHNPDLSARETWRNNLTQLQMYLPEGEADIQAEFARITSFLTELPMDEANYGFIHGDFELDNLMWQDENIAILDFDECSASWYVADIAFALRDLFQTGVDLNHPSFRAFVRGYSQHHRLDDELIAHLPMWMRLVNLTMYAKLVRAMDLTQDQDRPEWCSSLLLGIENWKQNYKASLLSLDL